MLKRIVFTLLLLTIPGLAGLVLGYAYVVYQRHTSQVDYQAQLEKQRAQFGQQLSQYIGNTEKQYPNGPASVIESDVKGYVENWERVNSWVAMPGTTGNYQPNVRGKYANTNDLGYRGTVNFRDRSRRPKKPRLKEGVSSSCLEPRRHSVCIPTATTPTCCRS